WMIDLEVLGALDVEVAGDREIVCDKYVALKMSGLTSHGAVGGVAGYCEDAKAAFAVRAARCTPLCKYTRAGCAARAGRIAAGGFDSIADRTNATSGNHASAVVAAPLCD